VTVSIFAAEFAFYAWRTASENVSHLVASPAATGRLAAASDQPEGNAMGKLAIWVQLEAKPGKEKEVEELLKSAQPLAEREAGTLTWYAIKMGPYKYGIFDTFADENGRNAHLDGEIAKALMAKASDLFAEPPEIAKPEILASKARSLSAGSR
jgi:quinol monooxygenase YgiN